MADKYEIKDMTGSLFVNKKKESEKHPDRNGTIKVNGVEYRIAGWIRKSKNGESYMSLAISEAKEKSSGNSNYSERPSNYGERLSSYSSGGDEF